MRDDSCKQSEAQDARGRERDRYRRYQQVNEPAPTERDPCLPRRPDDAEAASGKTYDTADANPRLACEHIGARWRFRIVAYWHISMFDTISKPVDIRRRKEIPHGEHVSRAVYVRSIPEAVEQYRKVLGIEPAKVRHDYAKFELQDPPVIFSLNVGGDPGELSHLGIRYPSTGNVASEMVRVKQQDVALLQQEGTTCCYAKADKFWVQDADGIPWEMYTLLEDVEAKTAADVKLLSFLGQATA